ncbi:exonuclease domain-containing protein [Aureibacter tunicatorum]|uniref:DNA polymerase-3 subunit epsilon n=1 Tax=Aureibacter tunicatorum TaxID=866807 RepID=A0AAE3XME9_9BACT|nr:exonuclease domain-containing protein [Aureibacter tunicatorum]MDR6239627.1 DNA polymerase-3 subunit epsilon [Aureibacter tunicatorum]BDD04103.1 exonuclease [Aureibacter tunicatorum]
MYAILDIETTGGNYNTGKITEIAIYLHDGSKVCKHFHSLVNPEKSIPYYITTITGIDNEMVAHAPKFYEIAKDIIEITDGATIVAHNSAFDYNFIKEEFKNLGYEFKRKNICTVRLSRKLIPGQDSYSLGKLTKALGIELKNHHRAEADAAATVQLFELLLKLDHEKKTIEGRKELLLHPNLSRESIEALPELTGVYYFRNEHDQIIYIGKSLNIKQRVWQHLYNHKTKKALEMKERIASIDYIVTGSELVALLKESDEIKIHKPVYNRAQRRSVFNSGIFAIYDQNGYINFKIAKSATNGQAIIFYDSNEKAKSVLFNGIEKYGLCQKLSGLYKSSGSCFHYTIKQCSGACIQEETPEDYNLKATKFIDNLTYKEKNFLIIDKGINEEERSLICIENGRYIGFGTIQTSDAITSIDDAKNHIQPYRNNKDTQQIIRSYLSNKKVEKIIKF